MKLTVKHFPTLPSTSTWVAENSSTLPSGLVAITDCQTLGRGQRGNSWEAEPGKNLTFTLFWKPENIAARRQFRISQAVALAIVDCITPIAGEGCTIKWPNDIYVDDRKIAGILISHALAGPQIQHTLIGVGLNVNQKQFLSDAPNPVSLTQITGQEYPLQDILTPILERFATFDTLFQQDSELTDRQLHERYMQHLWRNDGRPHPFRDTQTGEEFIATLFAIEPMGHLILQHHPTQTLRRYAFKEVQWL